MSDLLAELRELSRHVEPALDIGALQRTADVVQLPPPVQANPQWDRCKGWIEASLEGSLLKVGTVENGLRAGSMTLWPGRECAIVTEVMTYDGGDKAMQCVAAGGKLEEIAGMIGGIEAAARAQGCTMTLIEGRRGWSKLLKANGYGEHSTTMSKRL